MSRAETLTVERSTFSNNNYNGLTSTADHTLIRNSVISNNSSNFPVDAVSIDGSAEIENVLIANNLGSGLVLDGEGSKTLNNVTIANNASGSGASGVILEGGKTTITNATITGNYGGFRDGVGISVSDGAFLELNNSIVLGNGRYSGMEGNLLDIASDGNLIGDRVITSNGSISAFDSGEVFTANPEEVFAETFEFAGTARGVLADNGGDTLTVALLADPDNPALNSANPDLAPETDQRGFERVDGPDIGAFELQQEVPLPGLDLPERVAVDPSSINGIDPDLLVGTGQAITVTFLSEGGTFDNSLGYYSYNEQGEIGDVGLVFAGDNHLEPGGRFVIDDLEDGERFGFFLIQDGLSRNPQIAEQGEFHFESKGGWNPVFITDEYPGDLIFTNDHGETIVQGTVLHALNINGENPLNKEDALTAVSEMQGGSLFVGFEDDDPGNPGNDLDYNDLVIRIDGLEIPTSYTGDLIA